MKQITTSGFFRENLGIHNIVKHNVIALCGEKGSGKDSFFKRWTSRPIYPSINLKFATKLNLILNDTIGSEIKYEDRDVTLSIKVDNLIGSLNRHVAEGFGDVVRVSKDTNTIHMSWREIAEWVGTGLIRSADPDYFVNSLKPDIQEAKEYGEIAFLSDVRFDNELECASLAIAFKRDDAFDLAFDPYTHPAEQLGKFITVWSNRYMMARDLQDFFLADAIERHIKNRFKKHGVELHAVYQTMLDADGALTFTSIKEAYFLLDAREISMYNDKEDWLKEIEEQESLW